MGIRVTGISTPVGGLSWEYTRSDKQNIPLIISPGQKIKVFISSICGVEKYDKVRAELKSAIEATQLADAYTFESKGASTLTAGDHYTFALEESDICIFLIDNADGIRPRVQGEIDTVKKYNIKALYYFCDENQKEKTALEQSLMGAHLAKSKTVHSFSELSKDGAQALIEDIIAIYHYYCKGRIIVRPDERDEVQEVEIAGAEKYQLPTIPKATLKNVDKCRDYILKFVLGYSRSKFSGEKEKSSEIDEWGLEFLQVLLEGKSIKRFNTAMYMETLKGRQEKEHYQIVCIRWQAIQAYFSGDIEKCVLDNEKEREQIKYSPLFLCVLRRQNYAITEEMDKKIAEYLPSYYGDTYRLEITENENEDMPGFVREYAERIRKSNETQGKNGIFFGHGTREIATVRAILLEKEFVCDSEIIDVLISTVADTLLIFKGKYRYKT